MLYEITQKTPSSYNLEGILNIWVNHALPPYINGLKGPRLVLN